MVEILGTIYATDLFARGLAALEGVLSDLLHLDEVAGNGLAAFGSDLHAGGDAVAASAKGLDRCARVVHLAVVEVLGAGA
jgi:hypothetical protein